jgi:hypothetical protein
VGRSDRYLRSLGSVDDCYGSLELPRQHHVEMNVVLAQWMGRLKQMWLSEVVVGQVRLRQSPSLFIRNVTNPSFGLEASNHMASRHVNKQAYHEGSYKVH